MTKRSDKKIADTAPQEETVPGPTYPNPNEDETYVPPESGPATDDGTETRRTR